MDIVSPNKVAQLMGLSPSDLASAAGVHLSDFAANPRSPRLQAFLHDTLRVLNAAKKTMGAAELPTDWLLNEPLSAFSQKTAFELIQAGRTDAILEYLNTFTAGFVG